MYLHSFQLALNTPSIRFEDDDDVHSEDDDYDNEDEQERSDDKRSFPFFTPVTPYLKTIVETDSMLRESDTEWDCLADRAAALDEQKVINRIRRIDTANMYLWFKKSYANLVCSVYLFSKMEQFMCRSVRQMADMSAHSAIVQSVIAGVLMKIQAKIYPAHRSKMDDRTVQRIQRGR